MQHDNMAADEVDQQIHFLAGRSLVIIAIAFVVAIIIYVFSRLFMRIRDAFRATRVTRFQVPHRELDWVGRHVWYVACDA